MITSGGVLVLSSQRSVTDPSVVIDGAIAKHFETLRGVSGGWSGVRVVPRVDHAYAFDRNLLDPADRVGSRNAGRFEDGRHDVDDVMELTSSKLRPAFMAELRPRAHLCMSTRAQTWRRSAPTWWSQSLDLPRCVMRDIHRGLAAWTS